jgi:hypothetical protein
MKLPMLDQDKANHAVYGSVIAALVGAVVRVQMPEFPANFVAFCVVVVAALFKEHVMDRFFGGTVDNMDAVATVAGSVPVLMALT